MGVQALPGLDLTYLQVELQRLDVRLQAAIQRWGLAGQDEHDAYRGLYISDQEADTLLRRPLATNWGHIAVLPPEAQQLLDQRAEMVEHDRQQIVDAAAAQDYRLRLHHLQEAFGLSRFELDVLLLCLAPSVDLRYERIYGYLQDDVTKKRPTVNLALDLLAEPGMQRLGRLAHFTPEAPLLRHHLLDLRTPAPQGGQNDHAPLLSHWLNVGEALLAWLLGSYRPHPALVEALIFEPDPHASGPFEAEPALRNPGDEAALYLFHGPDEGRWHAAAQQLAADSGRPLLVLDLARVRLGAEMGVRHALRLALRDALLTGALPVLSGWDACLVEGEAPVELVRDILAHPGPVVVAGASAWQPRSVERRRRLVTVRFPAPSVAQRRQLWAHYLGYGLNGDGPSAEVASVLDALAGQFALTSLQIRDAVATARDHTSEPGAPTAPMELFAAARAHSNPRLATLAHKLVSRYAWDDIVLPTDEQQLLREIVDTVRERPQVLDAWGVGDKLASSRGITVLFAGPPGTGKTMAAEIIAAELGLDLYKIDLSTIVSKYIGETEKNISQIFREAEQSNAILFFDEADALFGKRSEVRDSHDRYANIEISYLLQRMEAYDGVTILATNLRSNLDDAFTRRLQFAVNFPFPEAEDRRRIWETLFPADLPRGADLDFGLLAERFRLAGGNIRNIIVSAAYLAAASDGSASDGSASDGGVSMAHLLHGTRRELQKMGRLVREEDLLAKGEQRP